MPVCIFRGRIIQSPWAGHSVPAFKPTSKTRAVQPILLLIPWQKRPEHPGSRETKTSKSHPSLGLVARSGCRSQDTQFFCQYRWEKNTSCPGVLSLLFTRLSCSPGFLEIARKPSSPLAPAIAAHAPFACLWRRLQLLGGTVAVLGDGEVRKSEPGSVSSLRACERGMHSPCGFPGLARARAAMRPHRPSRAAERGLLPAAPCQRAVHGQKIINKPVKKFTLLPCKRLSPHQVGQTSTRADC